MWRFVCAVWMMGLLVVNASANDDKAAQQLSKLLASMQTLKGEFNQRIVDANGELIEESTGKFVLQRPGMFRWETEDPLAQLLISDQKTLWLYDPDLTQVTIRPVDERMQQTPALLLSGEVEKINKHFTVEEMNSAGNKKTFVLIPKQNVVSSGSAKNGAVQRGNLFKALQLKFVGKQLDQMTLKDSLEQTTTISLNNVVLNSKVSKKLFTFDPPPGTEIYSDD